MKQILKGAIPFHDYESEDFVVAKAIKIVSHCLHKQFQPDCQMYQPSERVK